MSSPFKSQTSVVFSEPFFTLFLKFLCWFLFYTKNFWSSWTYMESLNSGFCLDGGSCIWFAFTSALFWKSGSIVLFQNWPLSNFGICMMWKYWSIVSIIVLLKSSVFLMNSDLIESGMNGFSLSFPEMLDLILFMV